MKLKIHISFHIGLSFFLISYTVLIHSCSGCKSGKITNTADTPLPDTGQVVTHVDTVPSFTSGNNGTAAYKRPGNISLLPADDSVVDDYNVRKQILEFKSPKTLEVFKTIDLVKENPFHKMGLKRRKEPYPTSTYFLELPGVQNKYKLRNFLPKGIFHEIPEDFDLDRAIATIYVSMTENKYATIAYELDWLPDAYSDEGEWDGPGYSVHHVVVYDSSGNKIYTRQFDGTSIRPSVSEDGRYLFTMACISPEWDENIRYRFTVVNIQTDKVVYEELIENCKKHGGGGDFYPNFYNANGYYAEYKNNHVLGFTYIDSKLYSYYNDLKFKISSKSKYEKLLTYPDGKKVTVQIDSLYNRIKLD